MSVAIGGTWRRSVAAGEGVRSALAGRWLSAAYILLVCWAGAVPGAVDAVSVAGVVADEQRFLSAGGAVVVVENEEGGVPALSCDRLPATQGVIGAAALIRSDEPVSTGAARGGDLPVFGVTGGVWQLLGAESSSAREAILPASLAQRLGVRDGDWLALEPSPGTRGAWVPAAPVRVTVVDAQILGQEYRGLLLPITATDATLADACAVAVAPAALPALQEALPAALGGAGRSVVRDRLITGEFSADYSADYQNRPLQWAWPAVGCLLGLVWQVLRWVRRGDDALYAAMGADRTARLLLHTTQWGLLAAVGGAWALTLGTIGAVAGGAQYPLAVAYVGRHVAASLLVAAAIVLICHLRAPRALLADLKDR